MADSKVTALSNLTGPPADGDEFHLVDVSDTTDDAAGSSKAVTVADLMKFARPGAYTYSASHNITTTESTVPFDTEEFDPDSNYTNSTGEITVAVGGYYQVSINLPISDDGTAGATRGRVFTFLQRDQTTATWVTVPNIRGQVYEREASGGTGLHAGGIVSLSDGEAVRVRVDVSSTVDVSTESGEASINLHRIR